MVEPTAKTKQTAASQPLSSVAQLYFRYSDALLIHLESMGHDDRQAAALLHQFFSDLLGRSESFEPSGDRPARAEERVWLWTRLGERLPGYRQELERLPAAEQPAAAKGRSLVQDGGTVSSWMVRLAWHAQIGQIDPGRVRAFVLVELDRFSPEEAAAIEGVSVEALQARLKGAHQQAAPLFRLVQHLAAKRSRDPWKA